MERFLRSVMYLRSLSVGARHAILWSGSLILFVAVFTLWVGQVRHRITSAFQFGPTTLIASPLVQEPSPPIKDQQSQEKGTTLGANDVLEKELNGVVALMKKGTAGIFSFITGGSFSSDTSSRQEGQELDKFLKYQEEFYQPFPAGQ